MIVFFCVYKRCSKYPPSFFTLVWTRRTYDGAFIAFYTWNEYHSILQMKTFFTLLQ